MYSWKTPASSCKYCTIPWLPHVAGPCWGRMRRGSFMAFLWPAAVWCVCCLRHLLASPHSCVCGCL